MTPPAWIPLREELLAWQDVGRQPTLWWRDDDAVAATPMLNRLIDSAGPVPLGLAVIPNRLEETLQPALPPHWVVLQHGFSHINHEPPGTKKSEFGPSRGQAQIEAEITRGRQVLRARFGDQFFPLFVSPWNRITSENAAHLKTVGLAGLSVYKDRSPDEASWTLNTQVDILDWQAKRRDGAACFIGLDQAITDLVAGLQRRRLARDGVDPREPVGILSHHLEHDAASWDFLTTLAGFEGITWISPREALTPS